MTDEAVNSGSESPKRCLIVAEVAQAHDGSLGLAHAFIDAVAAAGADAVKFQTHIAAAESTPSEPWRIKFSFQDTTRYEYWKRMEFTEEQWCGLKEHALEKGVSFLSSPFSVEAVELLTRIGVAAWKVASGEVANELMFQAMTASRLPMYLSTGMSSLGEIDAAVERVKAAALPLTVLQCTSMYPTPPEGVRFIEKMSTNPVDKNMLSETLAPMRDRFTKSVVARMALPAGTIVEESHLTVKKPGIGIPSSELPTLLGRILARPVVADQILQLSDFM
jgi:sialic acid synthase SpsE